MAVLMPYAIHQPMTIGMAVPPLWSALQPEVVPLGTWGAVPNSFSSPCSAGKLQCNPFMLAPYIAANARPCQRERGSSAVAPPCGGSRYAGFTAARAEGLPHQRAGHDALLPNGRMGWKAGLQGQNAAGSWPSSVRWRLWGTPWV
jgi:hypothetical protein